MYFYRCTEQQLNDALQNIHESGDRLLQAVYKGGRDWVLICLKAVDSPRPVYAQIESGIDTLVAINRELVQIRESVNQAAVNGNRRAKA